MNGSPFYHALIMFYQALNESFSPSFWEVSSSMGSIKVKSRARVFSILYGERFIGACLLSKGHFTQRPQAMIMKL